MRCAAHEVVAPRLKIGSALLPHHGHMAGPPQSEFSLNIFRIQAPDHANATHLGRTKNRKHVLDITTLGLAKICENLAQPLEL